MSAPVLPTTMPAVILNGKDDMTVEEVPVPAVGFHSLRLASLMPVQGTAGMNETTISPVAVDGKRGIRTKQYDCQKERNHHDEPGMLEHVTRHQQEDPCRNEQQQTRSARLINRPLQHRRVIRNPVRV